MSIWEILLLALALAMDALAVSVGLGLSQTGMTLREGWRCAARAGAAFGLFQTGMTLGGWAAGRAVSGWVAEAGHWVAAGILVFVGLHKLVVSVKRRRAGGRPPQEAGRCPVPKQRMRTGRCAMPDREARDGRPIAAPAERTPCENSIRASDVTLVALLGLAVATSLDALGAGLGLAVGRLVDSPGLVGGVWTAAAVIGLVACVLSVAGMLVGGRLAGTIARRFGGKLSQAAEVAGGLVLLGLAVKIAVAAG